MTRDPVAELHAGRAAGRHPSTLIVPVRVPFGPPTAVYWLTLGQYLTLAWLRRRMRHHRGETTLERMGDDLGADRGTLTHRLDRLAQLSLIGRHSTRGRLGRTRFWPPRRRRVDLELAGRRGSTGNVVTSTPFGGFLTREGLGRALRGTATGPPGSSRSGASAPTTGADDPGRYRRGSRRPPRLHYVRCPLDSARIRVTRRELSTVDWRHHGGPMRLRGTWAGRCPRCRSLVVVPVDVTAPIPPPRPRGIGDPPAPVIRRTAARRRLADELLEAGLPESAELRERIRARWAPHRKREYDALATERAAGGPPVPRRELPILVASDPADTAALVTLSAGWMAGTIRLDELAAAGYGPNRTWWDLSRASRPSD